MRAMKMMIAAGAVLALSSGFAFAESQNPLKPTPSVPAPPVQNSVPNSTQSSAAAAAKTKVKVPVSAELQALRKQCSAQADAKNLHGKERQTFRNACIKNNGKTT